MVAFVLSLAAVLLAPLVLAVMVGGAAPAVAVGVESVVVVSVAWWAVRRGSWQDSPDEYVRSGQAP